jgi:hypothetical protein
VVKVLKHLKGVMEMRYTTKERVAGVLPVGEKQEWQRLSEEEGFKSLWGWVVWVVRRHIKKREEGK